MNVDPVTARWCEALFSLAGRHGKRDVVAADLQKLARELSGPLGRIVFDNRVSLAERRAKLEPLLSGCDALTSNFVHLCFDKRRAEVLRTISAAFAQRQLAEQGAIEGVVESARPLAAGDVAELALGLAPLYKKRLVLTNRVRPELIAGVRVIADGRMLDVSALGRLDGLKKRLLEAPLPAPIAAAPRA